MDIETFYTGLKWVYWRKSRSAVLYLQYQLFHLYFREVEQEIAAKLQELKLMNFEDKEETMLENKI